MNGVRARQRPIETAGDAFSRQQRPLISPHHTRNGRPHAMTISMYKASVPVFVQFLMSMSAVLDKAAAYAEAKIAELNDRIAKTIDFLKSLKPAQIDGSEDKAIKITFPSGATRQFTGQSLLLTNSLPNFYFHCTTAYDILRHCGIELGKRDFMGAPVSL